MRAGEAGSKPSSLGQGYANPIGRLCCGSGTDSAKAHNFDPETRKQCSLFLVVMAFVDLTTVNCLLISRKLASAF